MLNNSDDIKYFQPSFFDTHPEFGNEEEMLRLDRQQDEEMPFWAEEFDDDELNQDYDFSDNAEAVDKELPDARSKINKGNEPIESEDFHFFASVGQQEIEWQEVFEEYENVDVI